MKQKLPLRKPLILTYDEAMWLMNKVAERRDDLKRYLARGRKGQRTLQEAVAFLSRLQRKLWKI